MVKYVVSEHQKAAIAAGQGSTILDALSIVSGFRRVGLVSLHEYLTGKPLADSAADLEDLLKQHGDFGIKKLKGPRSRVGLYLVFDKHAEADVEAFCKKYDNQFPDCKQEGAEDMGKLLGYPECCIKNRGKPGYHFPLIGLVACSEECGAKWFNHYVQLAKDCGVKEIVYCGEPGKKPDLTKYGFVRDSTAKVKRLYKINGVEEIREEEAPRYKLKLD